MTDATDVANGKFYYNLPGGVNFWSGLGSDYIVRFPAVDTIGAEEKIVIAMGTSVSFK